MKISAILLGLTLFLISCGNRNAEEARTGEAVNIESSEGQSLAVDSETSQLFWRGTKPAGDHTGTVVIKEGNVALNDGIVSGGKIVVDLTRITNDDLSEDMKPRLVGHLMSEDFFHTEQFPEAVFEISALQAVDNPTPGSANFTVTGNLTMRGVTKSISFPAFIESGSEGVHARTDEFAIDRTLWGVNFKSKSVFAEFKDDFISDMINLKFDVYFRN